MNSSDPNPGPLLAKIGAWMQAAQVIGFAMTFVAMSKTVQSATPQNPVDPTVMSAAMGEAMRPAILGIAVAVLGIMLIILAATAFRYRAAWFFRFLCIYGGATILSHMLPLGIFLLTFALLKRKEFERDDPEPLKAAA